MKVQSRKLMRYHLDAYSYSQSAQKIISLANQSYLINKPCYENEVQKFERRLSDHRNKSQCSYHNRFPATLDGHREELTQTIFQIFQRYFISLYVVLQIYKTGPWLLSQAFLGEISEEMSVLQFRCRFWFQQKRFVLSSLFSEFYLNHQIKYCEKPHEKTLMTLGLIIVKGNLWTSSFKAVIKECQKFQLFLRRCHQKNFEALT